MKRLVKLALAAIVVMAGWRVGTAYVSHYTFRDEVRQAALTEALDDDRLKARILELATAHGLPQDETTISIRREERRTTVEGGYVRAIELVPGYVYPWRFDWAIDGFVAVPPRLNEPGSLRR